MNFTVDGIPFDLTRDDVLAAMDGVAPEPILKWAVEINGTLYPPKQVFARVTGLGRQQFIATTARNKLHKLGFPISAVGLELSTPVALPGDERSDVDLLVDAVRSMEIATLLPRSTDYGYPNLPLCLIDAVFSIGIRYTTTRRVVEHFTQWWDSQPNETSARSPMLSMDDLAVALGPLADIPDTEARQLTKTLFGNLNRTSSQGGVLKSIAVARAADVLLAYGIDTREDLLEADGDDEFESAFRSVPGQSSGISLRYLYMLAGNVDEAKPDRMILRYISRHIGRNVSPGEAVQLLQETCAQLRGDGLDVNVRDIDNAIWRTESSSGTPLPTKSPGRPARRSKYGPLGEYLKNLIDSPVTLTFAQIEEIIGAPLPPSASRYPAFWANHHGGTHVWATAWMDAGWRVVSINVIAAKVTFARTDS